MEALLAKAQLLRLKNDGPGAMAVLDDLIATQPTAMQAHLDRASLALAMGKNDLAKTDIEAVLKGTPGNVQAIYLAAVMEAQAGAFRRQPTRTWNGSPASSPAFSVPIICRRW